MRIKHELFCQYYVGECNGNGSASAIKAGYAPNVSRQTAYKLLHRDDIKGYICELRKQLTGDRIATIEEVQAFWTDILRNDEEPMKNRIRVSELLAKAVGVFDEKW